VCKRYRLGGEELLALNNLTTSVAKGEFVALTGRSGSGKTSLMNLIGCLDRPSSGSITIGGRDISTISDKERAAFRNAEIGFVFQQFNLLASQTAVDNVGLPLIYSGISRPARRVRAADMLERVGLGNRINHLPTQLSGGQQQRVAIARALVCNPSVLLADEPTGALDSRTAEEIIALLTEFNRSGVTIILVTHDSLVARHAKRVLQLFDGQLISDTPA